MENGHTHKKTYDTNIEELGMQIPDE